MSPQSNELLDRFLQRGFAPNTQASYGRRLTQFFKWCDEHSLDPLAIDPSAVGAYMSSLRGRGLSPATQELVGTSLRSFYDFAVEQRAVTDSPVRDLRPPRSSWTRRQQAPDVLARDELRRLVLAADASNRPDDSIVVRLLALNGLRSSEIRAADVEHLRRTGDHVVLRLPGRNSGASTVLSTRTADRVVAYVGERKRGPLIQGLGAPRISGESMRRTVRRSCDRAGVPPCDARKVRHSMGAAALEVGVPFFVVASALGVGDSGRLFRQRFTPHVEQHAALHLEVALLGASSDTSGLLAQVDRLIVEQYHPALAIATCGMVLEQELRAALGRSGVTPNPEGTIDEYAKALVTLGVLSKQLKKEIDPMVGRRNTAAHGRAIDELTMETAADFRSWLGTFLPQLHASVAQRPKRRVDRKRSPRQQGNR